MKDRSLLMIPGPFVNAFGRCLENMRDVWLAPEGQPFIVAGSGTLAMELAGANLIEPDDRALVLSTGVFGDRYEDLLMRHGADVTVLHAPIGVMPQ